MLKRRENALKQLERAQSALKSLEHIIIDVKSPVSERMMLDAVYTELGSLETHLIDKKG